jgi:hypothetical protein
LDSLNVESQRKPKTIINCLIERKKKLKLLG